MQLTCQYEVTKAMFNPHNTNMIIGATTAGYILEWDVRAKKDPVNKTAMDNRNRSQPIQKSCLAKEGHNYPVFAMSVVGSQNAHQIVSISNDGRMCSWMPTMLLEPNSHSFLQIAQDLKGINKPGHKKTDSISTGPSPALSKQSEKVNTHCMDFAEGETDKFFVGAEDFNIY